MAFDRHHQHQQRLTVDGDAYSTDDDDDDLDKIPKKRVKIDLTEQSDVQSAISNVPSTSEPAPVVVKDEGERVEWSDEDGIADEFASFSEKKTAQKKKRSTRARKVNNDSVVGRKPRPATGTSRPLPKRKHDLVLSDSDDESPESDLPETLKQRRKEFETQRKALGEAGLILPPDFNDVDFSDDERIQQLEEKPKLPHLTPCAPYQDVELRYSAGIIPAPIAQWLREYQVKGAEFLHELFVFQKGGILGDDMGLGKTIQVIAFLTAAFGKTGDERDSKRMRKMRRMADGRHYPRVLLVCPGSLMLNWESELTRWGWWHVDVFHGSQAGREATLSSAKQGRLEIMITTYTTYRNHRASINMVDWDCVVADECHQIKERKAEITKAMNEVNALCRIGLTGTAIQNNYDELWTLLNWTNPGRFGPLAAWRSSIGGPLKMGQSHDATNAQLAAARKTAKKLVQNLLPQFFLRRMKSLIADQLPKKSDKVVFCPLTDIQAEAYENLVNSELIEIIRTSSDECECESGKKRGWCCDKDSGWQVYVFPCLMTLQKLSNHLAVLIPNSSDLKEKQEKELEYLQTALPGMWRELWRDRDSIVNYANQDFCGKWKVLKKLLRFWHQNGDKVLVFSHSVRLLKMLQMLFKSTTSYNVSYLDGSMSYADRGVAVDDFNSSPTQFVFLISTRAGGVGLNITSANKVVVFDPNWNPSYDLQAQDRAYRIGQTRDVEVFRLVSAGTVEEIVYARQIYKQQQANIAYNASLERRYFKGVQNTKEKKGEIFGLANIFSFQGDNVVLRDIVNKTNIAESKAGVSIVGVDLDAQDETGDEGKDGHDVADNEDAAISQLAAQITGEDSSLPRRDASGMSSDSKKTDAIAAILAGAGVEYTHENSEVIGSSTVEAKLSRRAEEAGHSVAASNDYVFAKSQLSDMDEGDLDDFAVEDRDFGGEVEDSKVVEADGVVLRYRPPEHVRKRHFVSMASWMGYEDAVDFALVVEGWTQEQRRASLEGFYASRRKALK